MHTQNNKTDEDDSAAKFGLQDKRRVASMATKKLLKSERGLGDTSQEKLGKARAPILRGR